MQTPSTQIMYTLTGANVAEIQNSITVALRSLKNLAVAAALLASKGTLPAIAGTYHSKLAANFVKITANTVHAAAALLGFPNTL